MLDNHTYNIMKQMAQEHKSLWRIKNAYKTDAGDCAKCQDLWNRMEEAKEAYVTEMKEILKDHLS